MVWGEGGCADKGMMFAELLSEVASHGCVIIAEGPPDGADLVAAIDWLEGEAGDRNSRFYDKANASGVLRRLSFGGSRR